MSRIPVIIIVLAALFASAPAPAPSASSAEENGTYCEHATGGCFGVPQPIGSVCYCGSIAGTITG